MVDNITPKQLPKAVLRWQDIRFRFLFSHAACGPEFRIHIAVKRVLKGNTVVTTDPTHEIQIDQGVSVLMRDGTVLRADVYRPKIEGKYPVIIERTQCWRGKGGFHQCPTQGNFFAPRGYVYVAQDIRGTFESEGEHYFGRNNGWGINRDGYDTIEWAAAQPWSNGRVARQAQNCPFGP